MKRKNEVRETVREIEAERARLTCTGCLGICIVVTIIAVLLVAIM